MNAEVSIAQVNSAAIPISSIRRTVGELSGMPLSRASSNALDSSSGSMSSDTFLIL
jgi:hypothetical protein